MRVYCPHCHKKALITSTNELSERVRDLYCICTNTRACGASFVFTLAYKNDINPPQQSTLQIATALVMHLKPADKLQLQRDLFA